MATQWKIFCMAGTDATKAEKSRKTGQDRLILRWRVIFACIAVAAVAIVLLLNLLAAGRAETAARQKADAVLAARFEAVFAEKEAPVTGMRVYPASGGGAFQFVFLAQAQNQADNSAYSSSFVFVVPVAGFSGPAVSVFYYSPDSGAQFLGNCRGRSLFDSESGEAVADTEISAGNLQKWASKIEAAAQGIIAAAARNRRNLYAGGGTEW